MTPFQLSCFISVESHLSFSKAAEDCHVAQATISRQITMLEEELGCRLFHRNSHGVTVTPEGEMFAHYAPVFLEYQRNILEQVRNASTHNVMNLRIGTGPFETLLIREPLKRLHEQYPNIGVEMNTYTYRVLLTRYRNKVLDLAICNDLCAASMPDFKAYELYNENWQVIAATDSPLWSLPYEEQQVLKGQTLITMVNDQNEGVRKYCFSNFFDVRMVETNFFSTMLEQVQAGLGIAIVPPFVAASLPAGTVMKDILKIPHRQRFFAMLPPSVSKEQTNLWLNVLNIGSK